MRRFAGFAAALALIAAPVFAEPLRPEEAAIKAHVAFLASDALRGREAGTPDYDVAAEYVAARMLDAGLEPGAADGGWFQPVPLVAATASAPPEMTLTAKGATRPMVFGEDFTVRSVPKVERIDVSAPVVFAGYGLVDKGTGRDDYAGLNVKGKIVAILYSGPKGLNSEIGAHLGNRADRAIMARDRGAIGVIYLETGQIHAVLPFERMKAGWQSRAVSWADAAGNASDTGAPSLGIVSFAGAEKLFGARWAAIRAADDAGKKLPFRGDLGVTLASKQRFTLERLTSANVVGRLPGSDPKLADETVILSAHLDHVGVAKSGEGDRINNGALDNAIGIAAMLEAARALQASGERPRRSIVFVAVTAEEKGLIGSDYYAQFPTVPKAGMVANVNLDMPILTYRFVDLVAFGADRSGVGDAVAAAAKAEGYALVPDPAPEEADFVRTDHYSFVRQGVPSVSLNPGPGGPGAAATKLFLDAHYHRPSDDLSQPIDWTAAAAFVRVNTAIARSIANADARPLWKKGDYFGARFNGPMAK